MNTQDKLPTSFWVVAVIALLWNIMGVYSFYAHVFISDEALAALPVAEQAVYASYPAWVNILFAVAVLTGLLGCISLLLKKAWAVPLFLISLVAVIIQMTYSMFMTESIEVYGPASVVMPILVVVIAAFLYYYSRKCRAKGWIT
jgi:uncharacterized membrane protein